jgi:response regulator RpfG family c-di-GMP phosphodiesterase
VERVCDHIASLAGTHFDPNLVPLFLDMHQCSEAEPMHFQNARHQLAA